MAQDSLYTVIGLGVLAFQQAQVRRRELAKAFLPLKEVVDDRVRVVAQQLRTVGNDA